MFISLNVGQMGYGTSLEYNSTQLIFSYDLFFFFMWLIQDEEGALKKLNQPGMGQAED